MKKEKFNITVLMDEKYDFAESVASAEEFDTELKHEDYIKLVEFLSIYIKDARILKNVLDNLVFLGGCAITDEIESFSSALVDTLGAAIEEAIFNYQDGDYTSLEGVILSVIKNTYQLTPVDAIYCPENHKFIIEYKAEKEIVDEIEGMISNLPYTIITERLGA